jgi:uncharacterized protein (TIGR02145 family)
LQSTVSKNNGKNFFTKKDGSKDRHKSVIFTVMKNTLFLFLFSLFFVACGDSSTPKNNSKVGEKKGFMTDSRDGQNYRTIKIGMQTWMAQNLNYESAGSYCYNDSASNCAKYGRLYTWAAAMDSAGTWSSNGKGCGYGKTCSPAYPVRGVCPDGWHLPTQMEWNTLFMAVGGQSIAGKKLKSSSGWDSDGNGTDDFLFSALPAGNRFGLGGYGNEGITEFWSSTEDVSRKAYFMYLYFTLDDANLHNDNKNYGFSVRCLKD